MEIESLRNYAKMSFQEKSDIIQKGRPKPDLNNMHQRKGQKITRSFQPDWYVRKEWLCGCAVSSRLFCFPCLLFSTIDSVWVRNGYSDLNNLPTALSKHEKSVPHIQSQIALKTFGNKRIDLTPNEQQKIHTEQHNKKVKENRDTLKRLIDVTCYLIRQELAFRCNDECATQSSCSVNRGNYVELIHLIARYDEKLATHLQSSSVFSGLSHRMQNDLIEAIGDVMRDNIKEEIAQAPFIAVEVDESTDITNKAQASLVLRYVLNSEVKEAFLGFDDVSGDRTAAALPEYVLGALEKYNCVQKLVAQTYDGASVKASELNGVQAKIKLQAPAATLTHCYAHKLNLVLSQSAKLIPECKVFFKTVEGLASFFNKSTKRKRLLDEVVKRLVPTAAPTRWNSHSRLVQTISHYHSDLRAVFQIMKDNPDDWDCNTLLMAAGFDSWLAKPSTHFLLMTYEEIFNQTDALFSVLQSQIMDVGYCLERIEDTINALESKRKEFDDFYGRFGNKCAEMGLTNNQSTSESKLLIKVERRRIFFQIIDNIDEQMKARYSDLGNLRFIGLVDSKIFNEMEKQFDDQKLESLWKYAKFFDVVRLKADLVGVYSAHVLRDKSPRELLSFIFQHDLVQTLPEATKLLQLVLTIPATMASVERTFSALKRIKTFNRNRTGQARFSSLAQILIEKERLLKLQGSEAQDFYSSVTEIFAQKERRMDFTFR